MTGKPVDLITLQNLLREKDVPPEISSLEFVKDLLTSCTDLYKCQMPMHRLYMKRQFCEN